MDRKLRKRIMRNIINNADQMLVVYPDGSTRLMSSLPVRTVFKLMRGMLDVRAVHGVIKPKRKPYEAPSVDSTSFPVIHAHGVH